MRRWRGLLPSCRAASIILKCNLPRAALLKSMVGAPEPRSKNRRRGDHMDNARACQSCDCVQEGARKARPNTKKVRGRPARAQADAQAPAREVIVPGRLSAVKNRLALPGER